MNNWKLLLTRETELLERYLRIEGYSRMFGGSNNERVREMLVISKNSLVSLYIDPIEQSKRRQAILERYKKEGIESLFKRWDGILQKLENSTKELNEKRSFESWKKFVGAYHLSRAIIMYSRDLGEVIDSKSEEEKEKVGKYHDMAETKSSTSWDRVKIFLTCLSQERQVFMEDLVNYLPSEVERLISSGEKVSSRVLNERKKYYLILSRNGVIDFFTAKDAELIEKQELGAQEKNITAKKLRGQIAFRGFVSGKVRIINTQSELSKMCQGDVLVSVMTTPRLMPAVKKASAIVTDEGGITSHAAIIARELKVPCIVGTKIATKVLKDGDMAEVDANRGIVKILGGK